MTKRRICIVTGSRAEFGLLQWIMDEVRSDGRLELQVVCTGMHLSPEFGNTHRTIEEAGFPISAKVDMLVSGDSPTAIAKSVGLGIIGFADAFSRLNPDLVVVLGDRYEILAAAQGALFHRIPLAHIHGGEVTEGALDEMIRHSLTKMAQLHFVSAEVHGRRVVQMGEPPSRVFNFGAPGLDNLRRLALLDRERLERELGLRLGTPTFLVTYHPATLGEPPERATRELLRALDAFPEATLIFTGANADEGGRRINRMLEEYVRDRNNADLFPSLGQLRYLSVLRLADVVVGNSSSGLIEAPALQKAVVNLGDRQKGRLRGESVLDCAEQSDAIIHAIRQALSPDFRERLGTVESPYGKGETAPRIKEVLATVPLQDLLPKPFVDKEWSS